MDNSQNALPQASDSGSVRLPMPRLLFIAGLIALAILARIVPHPANFGPVGAVALFAGAKLGSWRWAIVIPMTAMLLSDAFLGMHSLVPVVYGCLLFNVWLGWRIHNRLRPANVIGSSLIGSVVFFVVTNLGCWLAFYDHTMAGLTSCYMLAIPFFHNTVLGDLFFTSALFGMLALAERRFPAMRPSLQNAMTR